MTPAAAGSSGSGAASLQQNRGLQGRGMCFAHLWRLSPEDAAWPTGGTRTCPGAECVTRLRGEKSPEALAKPGRSREDPNPVRGEKRQAPVEVTGTLSVSNGCV